MTEHTQLVVTARDRFLQAAKKGTYRFRATGAGLLDREERAEKLQIPIDKIVAHN
jgi:hypothetical protein